MRPANTSMAFGVIALAVGLGIAIIDARPSWDDGISAAAVFVAAFLFGLIDPSRPWR